MYEEKESSKLTKLSSIIIKAKNKGSKNVDVEKLIIYLIDFACFFFFFLALWITNTFLIQFYAVKFFVSQVSFIMKNQQN
jgi:hypothetical protein